MAPSISVRESIRWLPGAAYEPTSTLVLTSGSNHFVDVRVLREGGCEGEDTIPLSRLDWAFAGTSSTSLRQGCDAMGVTHARWRHWIDSRHHGSDVEKVKDEGDLLPMDDGRTLERGKMENPATGEMTSYEEVWRDVEPTATPSTTRLTQDGNGDEEPRRCCIVLQVDSKQQREGRESEIRGMVVRVGQYVQGMLKVGESTHLERWHWYGRQDGWKRQFRLGEPWLPCGILTEPTKLEGQTEVKFGKGEESLIWRVMNFEYF